MRVIFIFVRVINTIAVLPLPIFQTRLQRISDHIILAQSFVRLSWKRFGYAAILIATFGSVSNGFAQESTTLRLPPSLERELRLKGATVPRVVRFSDTVKADKLIAKSLRDTTGRELDSSMVHDSAIVVLDSAVSLSHKEWLDSMIAELPETERTSEGLRFHYPDRMMVTTARRQVPFDTTLPMQMDPVSKEDMPLFEELGMPKPITAGVPPKYRLRIGIGTPYAPSIDASAQLINSGRTLLDAEGSFVNRVSAVSPFSNEWSLGLHGVATFASDRLALGDPVPMVSAALGARSLSRDLINDSGRSTSSLMRTGLDGEFAFGTLGLLRARGGVRLHFFTDNVGTGLTERSGGFDLTLEHQPTDSSNRFALRLKHDGASAPPSTLGGGSAVGTLQALGTISSIPHSTIDWRLGLSVVSAADVVANTVYVFPSIRLGKRLSNDLDLFIGFGQEGNTNSFDDLSSENPFYAPLQSAHDTGFRSILLRDMRRATITKYQATLGANYVLSSADYLHITVEFGKRHNEVAFFQALDSGRITRYFARSLNTNFFSATATGSMQFFRADRLRFSATFGSTSDATSDKQLPFVPIVNAKAEYLFGSILDRLVPSLGVDVLSRSDANFMFLNIAAQYQFSARWRSEIRLENVFDNDGAYWAPYDEHARRVGVSLIGTF